MSFDAIAPHYRWLEFVLAGKKLQRCRTAFLPEIPGAGNILLLGEGNGRFLPVCCQRFPDARITCVDASAAMLAQARRRLVRSGLGGSRVEFVQADVLAWEPSANAAYDLVVTNFLLDCFGPEQLERITRVISGACARQANWLLADFQVAPQGVRELRSRIILWLMYRFFRVATRLPARQLTPPAPFLRAAGFILHRGIETEWGLLHSGWWQRRE